MLVNSRRRARFAAGWFRVSREALTVFETGDTLIEMTDLQAEASPFARVRDWS